MVFQNSLEEDLYRDRHIYMSQKQYLRGLNFACSVLFPFDGVRGRGSDGDKQMRTGLMERVQRGNPPVTSSLQIFVVLFKYSTFLHQKWQGVWTMFWDPGSILENSQLPLIVLRGKLFGGPSWYQGTQGVGHHCPLTFTAMIFTCHVAIIDYLSTLCYCII